jgi:Domain of unknown function (DUF4124)
LTKRISVILLALAAIALSSSSYAQRRGQESGKLYRWVDKDGAVHYTDSIPPESANIDRNVLNNQGVQIGFEEGEITEAERAEMARREAEEEAARQAKAEIQRHDRMLLQTYIAVADIEDLRDRRLELLQSQIKVTELYLGNLRKRLVGLQEEASKFKPYTAREDAPQIPENLALDISRTTASINNYEQMLAKTRTEQDAVRASFDTDITRFRELKGG